MSDFGFSKGYSQYRSVGPVFCLTGGVPNTKGPWSELTACASLSTTWVFLNAYPDWDSLRRGVLLDIGIGAAGSEVPNLLDLQVHYGTNTNGPFAYGVMPLALPSSERISIRAQQHLTGTLTVGCQMILVACPLGNVPPISQWTTMGADETTSRGVNLPVTSAWAQISASTPSPFRGILASIGDNGSGAGTAPLTVDIGVGAAAAEVIIHQIQVIARGGEGMHPKMYFFPCSIPAGTRIAAKVESSNAFSPSIVLLGGI
jgi:hypothetical protein